MTSVYIIFSENKPVQMYARILRAGYLSCQADGVRIFILLLNLMPFFFLEVDAV